MDVLPVLETLAEPGKVERIAQLLKALGNPVRLRLVAQLSGGGEQSVSDLVRALDVPQAIVSQQLAILRLNGLVTVRSGGGFRHYSLAVEEIPTLLSCMTHCHLVTGAGGRG